ncbi:geraniol 8-hydroxylase-like [Syzygium oleosum]|uniref:geraniol 8-hydroxylase-like n=1 Tax=Syzygium oleosum TaxID=219896 RepID=UPI0024BA2D6F|nr:geraniol 8-hydroxylase-like [Syzygium oleosum]
MLSEDLADPSGSARDFKDLVWCIMVEAGNPNLADYFPALKKIDPQGSRRRMTVYFTKIFELFDGLIEKRLRDRATVGSIRKNDVLDTLLDAREDKSQDVDIFLIKHFLLDLFVAGTDTTSSTIEWALSELLHNPEKLSRAQAELDRVIGKGKPIEESEIARMPYLQAIIKETFRMHPPVPLYLPRKSGLETKIGGFTVPKGAQVLVNVWAIGRDPSIWKDPDVFMPERFLGSEIDVKGQDFELAPFGAGRRICPGLPLAMRILHWMLGSLINSFNWELEGGVKPEDMSMEEKFGITLQRAQPLRVIPKPIKGMSQIKVKS